MTQLDIFKVQRPGRQILLINEVSNEGNKFSLGKSCSSMVEYCLLSTVSLVLISSTVPLQNSFKNELIYTYYMYI